MRQAVQGAAATVGDFNQDGVYAVHAGAGDQPQKESVTIGV